MPVTPGWGPNNGAGECVQVELGLKNGPKFSFCFKRIEECFGNHIIFLVNNCSSTGGARELPKYQIPAGVEYISSEEEEEVDEQVRLEEE